MRNDWNPLKIAGAAVLAILLIAAVILGVRVAGLIDLTYTEAHLTPSPEPAYGNVMRVTIDPSLPTPPPMLRSGSEGEQVVELQTRLKELGYYQGEIDGQFGPGTRTAVTLFQEQHELGADGIVGQETRVVLYSDDAHPYVTAAPAIADVTTDGLPMLVNRTHLLPNGYTPADLVDMSSYCDAGIVTIKYSGTYAERVAVDALMDMLRAAHQEGITVWQISSAYRTVKYQQELFDEQKAEYLGRGFSEDRAISATRQTVADPGTSEHHLGTSFDITVPGVSFKGTKQANWLAEHCWEYGFILRYTEEKESITGFLAEPWHFRYVGVKHSIPMRDSGYCLEEYLLLYGQ